MRRCWIVSSMALAVLVGTAATRAAQAYTVAVVRPDSSDPVLVESFSRLCGELRMYGLQIRLVDNERAAWTWQKGSAQQRDPADLVGGVSLVRTSGQASAKIWVLNRESGSGSVRITVSIEEADAPSLLAMRAADLLRASLRNLEEPRSEPEPTGAERSEPVTPEPPRPTPARIEPPRPEPERPVPERPVPESPEPPRSHPEKAIAVSAPTAEWRSTAPFLGHQWTVQLGAAAVWETMELGWAIAPTARVERRISPHFSLAISLIAPAIGQRYVLPGATARLRQELGFLSLSLRLFDTGRLAVHLSQGAGAAHLHISGESQDPWIPQNDVEWVAASSTGLSLSLRFSEHLGLRTAIDAVFLLPHPVIDVADISYTTRQPLLLGTAAIYVGF